MVGTPLASCLLQYLIGGGVRQGSQPSGISLYLINTPGDYIGLLQTGEAIVLAPSGLGVFQEKTSKPLTVGSESDVSKTLAQFGRRYLHIKTRKRVTADGGASVLVLDTT